MKRITLIVLVLVAASLVLVGVAMANEGPHGDYTATTDACAGCHRAHTAGIARLLVGSGSISDFCLVCHGSSATGADTNVEDGYFLSTRSASTEGTGNTDNNAPLLGGGFVNYAAHLRAGYHGDGTPSGADVSLGVRCARSSL